MSRRPQRQAGLLTAALLVFCSLARLALGDSQATYQGKPLSTWIVAMRHDLDPEYRHSAMEAVARFGALAIPRLTEMLNDNNDPEGMRAATMVLIRLGPAGRTVVGERLTKEPKGPLLYVIDGISQSGAWARAFVPHLRTLVNSPEISLIALRTLAQTEAAPDPAALDPLVERQWDGPGGSVFLTPLDCFVKDRFSTIRAGVSPSIGTTVRQVGVTFKSAQSDAVYWTPARLVSAQSTGRLEYEAFFPKINTLGLTTVSYSVLAETSVGEVESEYVPAAISPTEEGCVMAGARPVPPGYPKKAIKVLLRGKQGPSKSR